MTTAAVLCEDIVAFFDVFAPFILNSLDRHGKDSSNDPSEDFPFCIHSRSRNLSIYNLAISCSKVIHGFVKCLIYNSVPPLVMSSWWPNRRTWSLRITFFTGINVNQGWEVNKSIGSNFSSSVEEEGGITFTTGLERMGVSDKLDRFSHLNYQVPLQRL